jgi:hypothetical protein
MRRTIAAVLLISATLALPATADAWAPAATAKVHPGVMTFTDGAQCTANFVYSAGSTVYLGQAAHCSGTGAATETNGCDSASLPEGTAVQIGDTGITGTMVYNSWIRMQAAGERDEETCAFNDLALIAIPAANVADVNPSVPHWGGPTGVGTAADGSTIYTYGNSSLRGGITIFSPKQGRVVSTSPGGWSRDVYTASPGVPGDSGSGFLNATGQAFGVLSTVQLAPLAGSNGVGDLGKEVAYAQAHGVNGLAVVPGTEPFQPGLL